MLKPDFDAVVMRLRVLYGPNTLTSVDELTLLAQAACKLNKSDFDEIVDEVVMQNPRRCPPLAALVGACLRRQKQIHERLHKIKTAEQTCQQCGNTGTCAAILRGAPQYQYVFRCSGCDAAEMKHLSKTIPLWSEDEHGERYVRYLHPHVVENLLGGIG